MELKTLDQYSKRELLELIVSNQVRSEQRIYKMYSFMAGKYGAEFSKNNINKGDTFEDFLDSFSGLEQQISKTIEEQEE
jgi:hypothetical protein